MQLVGQRFGRLLVIGTSGVGSRSNVKWECICDCGKTVMVFQSNLRRQHTTSCGCRKAEVDAAKRYDIVGKSFGRLTVISQHGKDSKHKTMWLCVCECGVTKVIRGQSIVDGVVVSCGCYNKDVLIERQTKHGHNPAIRKSRTYQSWANMIQRCTNPNNTNWGNYGERGITVCKRWRLSFVNFLKDMGLRPKGTSIDRIDVNGNYEPGNCRWATKSEQGFNKRPFVRTA